LVPTIILINDIIRLERVNVNRHISNSRKKTSNGLTIIVIVVELFFFLIEHQYPYPRHADGDEEDLVDIWALITEAKAGAQVHEQRGGINDLCFSKFRGNMADCSH